MDRPPPPNQVVLKNAAAWEPLWSSYFDQQTAIRQALKQPPGSLTELAAATIQVLHDCDIELEAIRAAAETIVDNSSSQESATALRQIAFTGEFIRRALEQLGALTDPVGDRLDLRGISNNVESIATFPLLIAGAGDYSGSNSSTGSGITSGGGFQARIDGAIRQVLGRMPSDANNLALVLQQRFKVYEDRGHTQVDYIQGPVAGEGQFGGMIAGAQASLVSLANDIIAKNLNLIDTFYPLNPAFNQVQADAVRSVTKNIMLDIQTELGRPGGPLVERVRIGFNSLLSDTIPNPDGAPVKGGYIGFLAEVFGLREGLVNTMDQESDATSIIIVRQGTEALQSTFNSFVKTQFSQDLGTRFVLLSRAVSVAADTLNEVYRAMDRVFIEQPAREVSFFTDPHGSRVNLQDALSWVEVFTTDQAVALVRDAGRRGAEAIGPTAQELASLMAKLLSSIGRESGLPPNLRHPGVLKTLTELVLYLKEIARLSEDLTKPIQAAASQASAARA
jgi:hypothetical protein